MSIYAIGAIKRNNDLVGVRLFSEENGTIVNTRLEQVIQYIKDGKDIRNLGLKNGKIDWTQGAMDRYPVLDADTLQVIDNRNSIIVLGYRDDEELGKELQIYSLVNYLGQIAELEEQRLVQYASQYQLANCKLVPKTGPVRHIVSLGGELKHMSSEVTWEYDNYYRELVCRLPEANITKLVVPNRVKGDKVVYPVEIIVTPQTKAKNITHIKVSDGIEQITSKLFGSFTRLRYLDIDSSINYVSHPFKDNYYLEGIAIKRLNFGGITSYMFKDLPYLKEVRIGSPIKFIKNSAFKGCKSLDIQSLIKEGLIEIGERAFEDCSMEELVLPKTLSNLDITAFNNCKNLKKVTFKGNKLAIKINDYRDRESNLKMFAGCGHVDVYVPYGTNIKKYVGNNVTVHESEPTEGDKKAERIEKKATIIGVDINAHDIAQTPSGVLGILTSITEEDWSNIVKKMLIDARNNIRTSVVHGVDGLLFYAQSLIEYGTKISKIQVSKDFALIWDRRLLRVVFINREVCKLALERAIEKRERYNRTYGSSKGYTYQLPIKNIQNSSVNPVKSINIISKDSFKITRKYGTDNDEIYTINDAFIRF